MHQCIGNCEFESDLSYDGSKCTCKPCRNHELCFAWLSPDWFETLGASCLNCNVQGFGTLEFCDSEATSCPVCLDHKPRFVKHPAGCNHLVCTDCFREMVFPTRPEYPITYNFGFRSPCSCCGIVQVQLDQCCDEYYDAEDRWTETSSIGQVAWKAECALIDHNYDIKCSGRPDLMRCPLCRLAK